MKKARFTEEQIIAILRGQEGGISAAEVCRMDEKRGSRHTPQRMAVAMQKRLAIAALCSGETWRP